MVRSYPLAAVLKLREQKESAEERTLLALIAEIRSKEEAIVRVDRDLAQLAASRAMDMHQVSMAVHHHEVAFRWRALRQFREELQTQLHSLEERRRQQQLRFAAAHQDRETLSKLKQKHDRAWQADQERQDRKRIDDLFASL